MNQNEIDKRERKREKARRKRQRRAERLKAGGALADHQRAKYVRKKRKNPTYQMIDHAYLDGRENALRHGGWPISKWILFCRECLNMGLHIGLYEAATTRSKYVYVLDAARSQRFKVRFSNHRPNVRAQEQEDSDFYVGVSNGKVTTTDDALIEVRQRFNIGAKTNG